MIAREMDRYCSERNFMIAERANQPKIPEKLLLSSSPKLPGGGLELDLRDDASEGSDHFLPPSIRLLSVS